MKQFILCFLLILLSVWTVAAQSKKPKFKVAKGFHSETSDGNKMGQTCVDTKQGKRCFITCFDKSWCGGLTKYTGFSNKKARSIGAEYIIHYAGEGEDASAREVIFTGRTLSDNSQSQSTTSNTTKYYFDITRPDCCALSDKEWQKISTTLIKSGIPTFFGLYDVLNYRENWRPVKLRRTQPNEGWLILGPFNSTESATKALYRLPKLLPNRMEGGDERRHGVESGPTGDPQTWQIGAYQINGFKTSLPIQVQKPRVLKAGTLEGIIVEKLEGANWWGIVVESQGVRYSVQLGGLSGGVKSQVGNVEKIGNRVRITYKDKRKENDGTYFLDATRIVQVKKKS